MFDPTLLHDARLAGGLTYREVGTAAGLDQSAIAHYEAGRIRPSPRAAERLKTALRQLLSDRLEAIAQTIRQL